MFINIIFTLSIKINVILSVVSKVLDDAVQCHLRLVISKRPEFRRYTLRLDDVYMVKSIVQDMNSFGFSSGL